jgi:2-iminoacetate synthase
MSFSEILDNLSTSRSPLLKRFEALIAPQPTARLAQMTTQARALTFQHFGRTMRMFAPLYLSNECINTCTYCGFSRDNPILRVTLEAQQVAREAAHLKEEGFRSILLVAGEHPKFVSNGYLEHCIREVVRIVPAVSLEVGPMETPAYEAMVAAGAEGLVVYQETYHRETYAKLHVSGPKRDFDWRLATPERAHAAGFRRIGIGALFGLHRWQDEAIALAAHLEYLSRVCWKSHLTVSLPRIRPAAGGFQPEHPLPDREFIQLICALRICFPRVGIVLSTREPAALRDAVIRCGVTMMSAGSHTDPGGYTGQGKEKLHLTVRGRPVPVPELTPEAEAAGQFDIADERSPGEVAAMLRSQGLEPVWKDWDTVLLES